MDLLGEKMADQFEERSSEQKRSRAPSTVGDLNDLEVFSRVVEEAGFSRAARLLGVPTSTVSRRVSRLENHLGVRLLQRTTRQLHLTDAGRVYYEHVGRALREIECAETSLREVQGTPKGRIRLTTVSEPFVEESIYSFMETYPDVSVEIDKSHRTVDMIGEGFDLAVRAGNMPDSSMIAHRLHTSHPVLVASPDYLKRSGIPKTASDLRDHDCVIVGTSSTAASWSLGKGSNARRVSISGRIAINHFSAAIDATVRGFGIGLIGQSYIQPLLDAGKLVPIMDELSPPPVGIWVVYPSRKLVIPAVRALIDHLKERFKNGMPPLQSVQLLAQEKG